MGNAASESRIGIASNFTDDEVERLSRRFKKLDLDNSGAISVSEFRTVLPELMDNPLVPRVISIFDTDGNGELDFQEFITGISIFSVRGDNQDKLMFAFKVYDIDGDGYISNGELFQTLKLMVGANLKEAELQQIVDKTILAGDRDGDGKLSFQEFTGMIIGLDISKKMNVQV